MMDQQQNRPIEVIEAIQLDERDGPALRISPRGAAWIVDAAVLLAAAANAELIARRLPDARPQP